MIITWTTRNNLRLRVLDVLQEGEETWFSVCKEFADPIMGRFKVRAKDTSAIDLLVA